MVLYELVRENEDHPVYANLASSSLQRQYHFLDSVISAALRLKWIKVSSGLIKALNYHAIACLHVSAGEYRPCPVSVGEYTPPAHYRVPELMNEMIGNLNRWWELADAAELGAYALWRLNWIHPFINGNGRTARALCYYVICLKLGGFPQEGQRPIPISIRENYLDYLAALGESDRRYRSLDQTDYLIPVVSFVRGLLQQP